MNYCYLKSQPIVNSHSHHLLIVIIIGGCEIRSYKFHMSTGGYTCSIQDFEEISAWLNAVRPGLFCLAGKSFDGFVRPDERLSADAWIYQLSVRMQNKNCTYTA